MAGRRQPGKQQRRAREIDDVIDVIPVARPLLVRAPSLPSRLSPNQLMTGQNTQVSRL
jgi:hypothetical protein